MMLMYTIVLASLVGCAEETCTYAGECSQSGGPVLECGEGEAVRFVAQSGTGEELYETAKRDAMEEYCCGDAYSFCEGSSGGGGGGGGDDTGSWGGR